MGRQPKWWRTSGSWVTLRMIRSGVWRPVGVARGHEEADGGRGVAGGFPDGAHAGAFGAADVGFDEVADEERAAGVDADLGEGDLKNARVGFAVADAGRVDADGEKFEEAFVFQVAVEAVRGDEGVGDDGELGAGAAEFFEHGFDAGVDVGGFADGLIPEPFEVVEVRGGDGSLSFLAAQERTSA